MTVDVEEIVAGLVQASAGIVPTPGIESWNHGWAFEEYRHSEDAAFDGSDGPVTFTPGAIELWERAIVSLLREPRMASRWDTDEVWGLLASLCETASHLGDRGPAFIDDGVHRMLNAAVGCTVLLIANTTWDADPIDLGDAVIGDASEAFLDAVTMASRGRIVPTSARGMGWLGDQVRPRMERPKRPAPTAIACWTTGQRSLAVAQASHAMREIVHLPLLLEHDLTAFNVYRRGELNRPGVRGLALDRGAIETAISGGRFGLELAAQPLTVTGVMRSGDAVHWYSAEPLPLGRILAQSHMRDALMSCLSNDPIAERLRVAARWYAQAHYAENAEDSALALGVGLDAMLNARQPLRGSAMADRAAWLRREPGARAGARSDYLKFYGVRSAVAHGGSSSKLRDSEFLPGFFKLLTDTAWRLLDLRETFRPASSAKLDVLFDELRLGTSVWPTPTA